MGSASSKSSKNKLNSSTTSKDESCCCFFIIRWCCSSSKSSTSSDSSSFSIDDKYLPSFDRLSINHKNRFENKEKLNFTSEQIENRYQKSYLKSIENFENSLHSSSSIDQWINALSPIAPASSNRIESTKNFSVGEHFRRPEKENLPPKPEERWFLERIKKFKVDVDFEDFRNRLKSSKKPCRFVVPTNPSKSINPSTFGQSSLIENMEIQFVVPGESIVPICSTSLENSCRIEENFRSKCFFIPSDWPKIDFSRSETEFGSENRWILSEDGRILVDLDSTDKSLKTFVKTCPIGQRSVLSSILVRKWFEQIILVNRTCAVAKNFLSGNVNSSSFLLKNSTSNFQFVTFRSFLPNSSPTELCETNVDAFSPFFLSNFDRPTNRTIRIDFEQYSFGLLLRTSSKTLIDRLLNDFQRSKRRRWPNEKQIETILSQPIILIPDAENDRWIFDFSLLEQSFFQLFDDRTSLIFALTQIFFAKNSTQRTLVKNIFLNFVEVFGLPRENSKNFFDQFIEFIRQQIEKKVFVRFIDQRENLYDSNENYHRWLTDVEHSLSRSFSSSTKFTKTMRPLKIEFLFHFVNEFYRKFHRQPSQIHLNEKVLADLHLTSCKTFDEQNRTSFSNFLGRTSFIEQIEKHLSMNFEINAELVHTCLNQIRKAHTSLIFHYTWTIYMQYLHTYYNLLWNIDDDDEFDVQC